MAPQVPRRPPCQSLARQRIRLTWYSLPVFLSFFLCMYMNWIMEKGYFQYNQRPPSPWAFILRWYNRRWLVSVFSDSRAVTGAFQHHLDWTEGFKALGECKFPSQYEILRLNEPAGDRQAGCFDSKSMALVWDRGYHLTVRGYAHHVDVQYGQSSSPKRLKQRRGELEDVIKTRLSSQSI